MVIEWSPSQKQRLRELGRADEGGMEFETVVERDEAFTKEVAYYQSINRKEIRNIQERRERHLLAKVEENIAEALIADGFLEVRTPTIISGNALVKMGIDHNHPLREQVFWLDGSRCLRPMLAPNLYFLMRHLKRNVRMPLQMFEIGTCYRKESHGSNHLEEFTMLNLVEMASMDDPAVRLRHHIQTVMGAIGLEYELSECESDVYGRTIDVEVNGVEVASAALGPHKLDPAHGITDAWSGVGFGLERLLMVKNAENNIKKVGRSLIYLGGARLDI
ncbi:MAG: Pyrrolysine--tRNA ligase [Methanomassiliicoccales archaeon PtaU1.Bin030]|jgi:phenylalanyl-tRNA synthetase alpha chain|nr:MAG: Pyrrolysine--tRNA ligase [Methanomassiliicoccales archaeon PtaU1.Bin030]